MKLEQIQEARYSGEHPLITQIKDAIANAEKTTIEVTIPLLDTRDIISTEYGTPKKYPAMHNYGSFEQYIWLLSDYLTVTLTNQHEYAVIHIYNYALRDHNF